MQTVSIVPNLDAFKDGAASFCVRCETPGGTLGFECAQEALSHGIAVALASATHAGCDHPESVQALIDLGPPLRFVPAEPSPALRPSVLPTPFPQFVL